jgi:hypothetical protein
MAVYWRCVRNWADADETLAGVNNHYGTRAILPPLNMAFVIFVAPQIRVLDYVTWPYRYGVGQSVHLVIEIGGFGRRLGRLEKRDGLFVKIARKHDLTISGFQPSVLVRRDQKRCWLSVAENFHWFALRVPKDLAKLALDIC